MSARAPPPPPRALTPSRAPPSRPHLNLVASQRPHLHGCHTALGLQHVNLGDTVPFRAQGSCRGAGAIMLPHTGGTEDMVRGRPRGQRDVAQPSIYSNLQAVTSGLESCPEDREGAD